MVKKKLITKKIKLGEDIKPIRLELGKNFVRLHFKKKGLKNIFSKIKFRILKLPKGSNPIETYFTPKLRTVFIIYTKR